jgi:hypothetical protein
MGLLNIFTKPVPNLLRLTAGSFTVDRNCKLVVSTLPSNFPKELIKEIGTQVLAAFRASQDAQLPLAEMVVNYPSLRITARELRGGAIIFLLPRIPYSSNSQN